MAPKKSPGLKPPSKRNKKASAFEKAQVKQRLTFREPSSFRPTYGLCGTEDLKALAKCRGIAMPEQSTRIQYIEALKNRDDTETFEFMELPAEIRNMIYERIIVNPATEEIHLHRLPLSAPPKVKRDLSILRVCRQIYQEASGVMIATHGLICAFQMDLTNHGRVRSGGCFLAGLAHGGHRLNSLSEVITQASSMLGKAVKINLIISLACPLPTIRGKYNSQSLHMFAPIVSMLQCFISIIMDTSSLQTLNLFIDLEHCQRKWADMAHIMSPLMHLYRIPTVRVESRGVPEAGIDCLKTQHHGSTPYREPSDALLPTSSRSGSTHARIRPEKFQPGKDSQQSSRRDCVGCKAAT